MKKNEGISEVLGSLLMIGVFVIAFGIITVSYLSQPLPEKTPQATFEIRVDIVDNNKHNLVHLIHSGGDSLKTYDATGKDASSNAEYYIRIDREETWPITDADLPVIPDMHQFAYWGDVSSDTNKDYLQPGEGLAVNLTSLPKNIDIIYKNHEGGETILWSGLIPRMIEFFGIPTDTNKTRIFTCVNEPVIFTDDSVGNIVYSDWDFDANVNPGIDASGEVATWSYPMVGWYTVTHNITTDEGYKFTQMKENYINVRHVHAGFTSDWDDVCDPDDNSCDYCKDNYPGRPCGREPLHVDFTDTSYCNPTAWSWDLGAGPTVYDQNPSYDYIYDYGTGDSITPAFYSVSLTASNSGGSDTLTKPDHVVVLPDCVKPIPWFKTELLGVDPEDGNYLVEFSDASQYWPEESRSLEWDLDGDHIIDRNDPHPVYEYEEGKHWVTLTVTNDCGKDNTVSREISFPCYPVEAHMHPDPTTGPSPLTVTFTDESFPSENITTWRWGFGDGTYYFTTDRDKRNPPPHTYTRVGTFHASLIVQNNCGQSFAKTEVIVASKDASISGKVWKDRNEDGDQDPGETGIDGWPVYLDERRNGRWEQVDTTTTNATGSYLFELAGVSNSVFRVRQDIGNRPGETWRTTYSHGTIKDEVSDNILIYDTRHYSGIDFGNNRLQTSKLSVPGAFVLKKTEGEGFYYDNYIFKYSSLSAAARFLDYNTTYDSLPRVVFLDSNPSPNGSFNPDPPGGYPIGYTSWGDSSFTLKMRKYNTYLKQVGNGAYFLDVWQYNDGTGWVNYYSGDSFSVPDNTSIVSTQLRLIYYYHPEDVYEFDKPDEGAIIPYTSSYTVEAHMEGKNEEKDKAWLITPVTKKFSYNSTVGEYLVANINTRPFEGQTKLFKGDMTLTNGSTIHCYANATIDWEPNYVSILNITSDIPYGVNKTVKGNTTVWASIGGKWQLNSSAKLILNGQDSIDMIVMSTGYNSTVKAVFNPESYSGRTIPVHVTVPHAKGPLYTKNSVPWNIMVLSKLPIDANFTAYPESGRNPHEVAFTDTSTGGANQWNWDFKDGETSNIQHPIHVFHEEGIFPVSLTVTNATPVSDSIMKNITVQGAWKNTTLLTNRYCSLAGGGMIDFITRGADSEITINGTRYSLPDGNTVALSLNTKAENAKIFIAGSISECVLPDANLTVNGEFIDKGSVSDIRIQDFENFHSNLTLSAARSYAQWVTFEWEGLAIPISWKRSLTMIDLMPSLERFMNLELSPAQTYFDGRAGTYYLI